MKLISNFILEKLILNKNSKVTVDNAKEIVDYIIHVFNISKHFFKYEELYDKLFQYVNDNAITMERLSTPLANGKDAKRYIVRDIDYRRGRRLPVDKCIKNADVIVGDPNDDYIVFYFSNECLLCHSTPKNEIEVNFFFLIL